MNRDQETQIAQAITGTFMWSFKRGDNIVYNYKILWSLYQAKERAASGYEKSLYNKPIMLTIASIVECILDDFAIRIIGHVHDMVPNMTAAQINDFKTKKRDKFEHHIAAAKKHNIFDADDDFYSELTFLKNTRNRFHIQNRRGQSPANESDLFTNPNRERAERLFEHILRTMVLKYYRGNAPQVNPEDIPYPWK